MKKRTQIIFLGIVSFLIIVLLGFNLALSRYGAFWQKARRLLPKSQPVKQTEPASKFSLDCPVPKEYCSEVDEIGRYLGFQLPPGTEIRAVMSGSVSLLKNNFGDVVIELRSVSGSGVFYTLRPADYLKLSRGSVKVGDILGKSGDLTQFSLKYNLLISLVDEDSNYYLKPKELFEL